jgi:hypothetical protein
MDQSMIFSSNFMALRYESAVSAQVAPHSVSHGAALSPHLPGFVAKPQQCSRIRLSQRHLHLYR